MANSTLSIIPLENLFLDVENPRYPIHSNQRDTIAEIVRDQREKLVNLAEDIAENGLNPSELLMVTATENSSIFTVLEGNRRIAALKLASSPDLVDSIEMSRSMARRFKALSEDATSR